MLCSVFPCPVPLLRQSWLGLIIRHARGRMATSRHGFWPPAAQFPTFRAAHAHENSECNLCCLISNALGAGNTIRPRPIKTRHSIATSLYLNTSPQEANAAIPITTETPPALVHIAPVYRLRHSWDTGCKFCAFPHVVCMSSFGILLASPSYRDETARSAYTTPTTPGCLSLPCTVSLILWT